MLRALVLVGVLGLFPSVASAQTPCTTDARRVVDAIYRQVLERPAGSFSGTWVERLENGNVTVRDLMREVAKSTEHIERFLQGNDANQAATYLYRHILDREPDPEGLRAHSNNIRSQGAAASVETMINSDEYRQKFGDDTVPGSVRYCRNGEDNQQLSQQFRGMDRDRNGVITRAEWRGSAQAFRNYDWNRDGVLSGEEIGATGQQQNSENETLTRQQFDDLDVNGDNRITRDEWRGSENTFYSLDRNGNGVLSRNEIVATNQGDRFLRLDVNRDGRVSYDEWRGSRQSFNQLDYNGDGVLSRRELSNDGAVPTTGR